MENASRALTIAAGVLIAIAVLSLGVYLFSKNAGFARNINSQLSEDEIYAFNERFYLCDDRINITANEIATLINFAKESNDNYELDRTNTSNSSFYADIKINGKSFFKDIISDDEYNDNEQFKKKIEDFLKNNNTTLFSCNANIFTTKNKNGDIRDKIINNSDDGSKNRTYKEGNKYYLAVVKTDNDIKVNNTTSLIYEINFYSQNFKVKDLNNGLDASTDYRIENIDLFSVINK